MFKYLLISLLYLLLLLTATIAYHHFNLEWQYLGRAVLFFGIPLLLFAAIATGMAYTLQIKKEDKTIIFQKPFRNIQIALSSLFTLLVLWTVFSLPSEAERRNENNIDLLNASARDEATKRMNMRAYSYLKARLLKTRYDPNDTDISVKMASIDTSNTIIQGQRMVEKISLLYTIHNDNKHLFHFACYCNDSVIVCTKTPD